MPLSVPAGVSAHLKLAPEGQNTPYWRDMSLFGVAICRQISSYAHFSSEMLSLALLGGFCARRYQSKRAEALHM